MDSQGGNNNDKPMPKGCQVIFFVLFAAFLALIFYMFNPFENSRTEQEAVTNSPIDGSVRSVEKYIKDNLKDPDSYTSVKWSEVQKEGNGYVVAVEYKANNSFGAAVTNKEVYHLDNEGNVKSVDEY